jgi:hypothetical protein
MKKKEEKKRLITKNSGLPKLLRWSHALRSDQKQFANIFGWQSDFVESIFILEKEYVL